MSDRLKKLNADKITALKAGDRTRKDMIVLMINEANSIAKNDGNREVTDDDVIMALNRTIKKARDTKKILEDNGALATVPDAEIALAQEYLPQQMSRDELRAKIEEIVGGPVITKSGRGLVMKGLNADYKGMFDSKMANEVVAEMMEA